MQKTTDSDSKPFFFSMNMFQQKSIFHNLYTFISILDFKTFLNALKERLSHTY